ncbi:MAG: T9SS type A sorting domain-containing protein, partial [Bacteroidota bacterium]
ESVRYPFNVSFPTLKPEILQVNDTTLMANYVQGIQWYKDGEIITNATSEVLVVQGSGVYGLSVEQSGCIEFAEIDITIASENEGEELVTSVDPSLLEGGAEFVYPNPTSRYLNIPFENLQIEQIQIIDSRGVTVYSINNLASEDSFYLKVDLVDIPGGLYSAIVTGKETQKTYQFIKN